MAPKRIVMNDESYDNGGSYNQNIIHYISNGNDDNGSNGEQIWQ